MPPTRNHHHDQETLTEMRAVVAARLKRVCDGMDDAEFEALVTQISEFKIKWGESLIYDNPPALGAWMFGRKKDESSEGGK